MLGMVASTLLKTQPTASMPTAAIAPAPATVKATRTWDGCRSVTFDSVSCCNQNILGYFFLGLAP
jgi:hypothetical protein